MTRQRVVLKVISLVIGIVFLWTDCIWAGLIQSNDKLAAQSQLGDIISSAQLMYTGDVALQTLIERSISSNSDIYRNINELRDDFMKVRGKYLVNPSLRGRKSQSNPVGDCFVAPLLAMTVIPIMSSNDGVYRMVTIRGISEKDKEKVMWLVFPDKNNPDKKVYYIFTNKGFYFRYFEDTGTNDDFCDYLKKGFGDFVDMNRIEINSRVFYREIYRITEDNLPAINLCLADFYGEEVFLTAEDEKTSISSHLFPLYIHNAIEKELRELQKRDPSKWTDHRISDILSIGIAYFDRRKGEIVTDKEAVHVAASVLTKLLENKVTLDDVRDVLVAHEKLEEQLYTAKIDFMGLEGFIRKRWGEKRFRELIQKFCRNYRYWQGLTDTEIVREMFVHYIIEKYFFKQPVKVLPKGSMDAKKARVPMSYWLQGHLSKYEKKIRNRVPIIIRFQESFGSGRIRKGLSAEKRAEAKVKKAKEGGKESVSELIEEIASEIRRHYKKGGADRGILVPALREMFKENMFNKEGKRKIIEALYDGFKPSANRIAKREFFYFKVITEHIMGTELHELSYGEVFDDIPYLLYETANEVLDDMAYGKSARDYIATKMLSRIGNKIGRYFAEEFIKEGYRNDYRNLRQKVAAAIKWNQVRKIRLDGIGDNPIVLNKVVLNKAEEISIKYQNLIGRLKGGLILNQPLDDKTPSEVNMKEYVIKNELYDRVIKALCTLKPREEKALMMYFFEDKTLEEIAQQFGMTGEGIRIMKGKALKKLRRIRGDKKLMPFLEYGTHIIRSIEKEEPEESVFTLKIDTEGAIVQSGEIPIDNEEKIRDYITMLQNAVRELTSDINYGLGLLIRVDEIEIVKNLRSELYGQGRAPLAVYIVENGIGKIKIDEGAFSNPLLVYEELEHEFLESIGAIIPGSNQALADVVSTVRNVRRFLSYSKEKQDMFFSILDSNPILDPDGEYKLLLIKARELGEGDIIPLVVGYVLRTKIYQGLRDELGLPDELVNKIRNLDPRVRFALAVFNEIKKAKQGKELIEKIDKLGEFTINVIKTFTGTVRIEGLERLSNELASIIAECVKIAGKKDILAAKLEEVKTKGQFCIVVDRDKIPKEIISGWDNDIQRINNTGLFRVFDSLKEAEDEGYKGKEIIHLLDPEDIEKVKNEEGILFLPLPYLRSALYIAALVVAARGNVGEVNPLAMQSVLDLYPGLRELAPNELELLFTQPWCEIILPRIKAIIEEINNIHKALVEIEKAA